MNPDAPVLRAAYGQVDPALLFPAGPEDLAVRRARTAGHAHGHDHAHDHEQFVTEELRVPIGLSEADAHAWIDARKGLRTKGFVATQAGIRVVQGVGRRLELTPPGDLLVPPDLIGRVVVIRRGPSHDRHM